MQEYVALQQPRQSPARLQGLKGFEHFMSAVMTKLAELATTPVVFVSVTHAQLPGSYIVYSMTQHDCLASGLQHMATLCFVSWQISGQNRDFQSQTLDCARVHGRRGAVNIRHCLQGQGFGLR